jgi:hypothetical protein
MWVGVGFWQIVVFWVVKKSIVVPYFSVLLQFCYQMFQV